MTLWHETEHCKSRAHCDACRNSPAFRAKIEHSYGPIWCPVDNGPPCPFYCRHRVDTQKPYIWNQPCKGTAIRCMSADNPLRFVPSTRCNKKRCPFHETKGD